MTGKTINETLEALTERLQRDDRKAMADLYETTSAHLYSIIYRILKDEAKASEILKQVYLHIWNTRHDSLSKDMSTFNGLRSTAHRFAIDRHLQTKDAKPVSVLPNDINTDTLAENLLSVAYLNAVPAFELARQLEASPEDILKQLADQLSSRQEVKQ